MFNQIVIWLVAGYVFINAIPHTPAARYVLLGTLVVTSIVGLAKKQFSGISKTPVVIGLGMFVGVALISALSSPYLIDSLQGFRKDYAPPLLVLLIATSIKQSAADKLGFAKTILWALLAGFFIKTLLALWDGALNHDFIFSPYSNPEFFAKNGLPKYVSYYAVESVLYLTLSYSALLFIADKRWEKFAIGITCSTSLFIVLASGIRSAFAATLIGLLTLTLIKLRSPKRILGFSLIAILLASGVLFFGKNNSAISRFSELTKSAPYSKENGMSGRYFIWEGVEEIISKRPLLGFGTGWQKLPTVATDNGLIARWQTEETAFGQLKHTYFTQEYGKVNPHNLILQILFETGWIGLVSYVWMLIAFFWSATTALINYKNQFTLWLRYAAISYGSSLFLIDITNSFLLHNTTIVLMLITALTLQSRQINNSGQT